MSTWKSPKWTKVAYVELCGSAAAPRISYSGSLTLTAITLPAKCKALFLLPAEMATSSPVSSKFHYFYIVSYLANLTVVPSAACFFFPKVLVGLWKMSWFQLKVRQPTKHGKSAAQVQSLTTFIALNSLSLLHWPLRSKWISHSIKQQSRGQFSPPSQSYGVIGCNSIFTGY